jgi:hypothetical protein
MDASLSSDSDSDTVTSEATTGLATQVCDSNAKIPFLSSNS